MACGSEKFKLLGCFNRSSGFSRSGFNSWDNNGTAAATATSRVTTAAARATAATTTAATTMMTTTTAARRRAAATATARRRAAATTATRRATAARRAAAAAATAATMTESRSFVFATDQSHANQREKDRDTQQNDTIHSLILHLPSGTFRRNNSSCRQHGNTSQRDGVKSSEVQPSVPCGPADFSGRFSPCLRNLITYEICSGHTG